MPKSLKHRTISGMLWNSIQRFGTMTISFISNLVLARFLVPEDFGCIGMLMFFLAISDTFIDGGFGTALIQKKNPTQDDYSTIFYWNIFIAVLFMVILYYSAPAIASFYKIPRLTDILRVQSIILLINAFSIIQRNRMVKQFEFKKLAFRDLVAVSAGTVVAIIMAYYGYGVWSLVAKSLCTGMVATTTIWVIAKWKPSFVFVWDSFKGLFKFGGIIFLSSMLETIYNNLQTLIIGRVYTAKDLGFFTQAKRMEEIPFTSLNSVINQVTFPAFSEIQDDLKKIKNNVQKNIRGISFLSFPMALLLIIIAKPLFTILLTSKWDESIPYFQLLCLSGLIISISSIHLNVIKALGKGKLFLYTRIAKRTIGIAFIIIGVQFSVMGLMIAITISSYVSFLVNMLVSKRIVTYRIFEQIKDIVPSLIISCIAGGITYYIGVLSGYINNYLLIFFQSCIYILSYLSISYMVKSKGLYIFYDVWKELK